MSAEAVLNATPRQETGKGVARKLRAAGRVPAVLYGGNEEPMALALDRNEAFNLFQNISVENTIITLQIEGVKGGAQALVREIQAHPFKPEILHVDFLRIQKGVAVELDVPIHFQGKPVGVSRDGGVLDQVIHSLHIRSIPAKIPESIEVDLAGLEIGDSLHVSDLELDPEMEVLTDPDQIVAQVAHPRREEAAEELDLEAAPEPEIVGRESAEEDEEA